MSCLELFTLFAAPQLHLLTLLYTSIHLSIHMRRSTISAITSIVCRLLLSYVLCIFLRKTSKTTRKKELYQFCLYNYQCGEKQSPPLHCTLKFLRAGLRCVPAAQVQWPQLFRLAIKSYNIALGFYWEIFLHQETQKVENIILIRRFECATQKPLLSCACIGIFPKYACASYAENIYLVRLYMVHLRRVSSYDLLLTYYKV